MIWFTSDWHFNDTRITKDLNLFFRPFCMLHPEKSKEELVSIQNKFIIDRINQFVKEDDTLFHIGDVSIDKPGVKLMDQIKCKDRHLIIGNYDDDKLNDLDSYFSTMQESHTITEHNLYLNHYPVNKVDKPLFNIVGHIHGLWKVQRNMVNVGLDAWNFLPVSLDTILFTQNAIEKHYDENVFIEK